MTPGVAPTVWTTNDSEGTALADAVRWLSDLATGSLAIGLCVIAIALVGLLMLTGRIPVRSGFRTVLGCFVLLGAPVIANAFLAMATPGDGDIDHLPYGVASPEPRPLPTSTYDPYAGASLRQD